MKPAQVIISGLAATTVMTVFSYIASNLKKRNYKEPELLAGLLKDGFDNKYLATTSGWCTHYSMGITWAAVFEMLFEGAGMKRDFKNGVVLGAFSGLTGIVIWRVAFKLHSNPPRTDYKGFYEQLLLAHIVYSLVVTYTSRNMK